MADDLAVVAEQMRATAKRLERWRLQCHFAMKHYDEVSHYTPGVLYMGERQLAALLMLALDRIEALEAKQ